MMAPFRFDIVANCTNVHNNNLGGHCWHSRHLFLNFSLLFFLFFSFQSLNQQQQQQINNKPSNKIQANNKQQQLKSSFSYVLQVDHQLGRRCSSSHEHRPQPTHQLRNVKEMKPEYVLPRLLRDVHGDEEEQVENVRPTFQEDDDGEPENVHGRHHHPPVL